MFFFNFHSIEKLTDGIMDFLLTKQYPLSQTVGGLQYQTY